MEMSREAPTLDDLYGAGAEHADELETEMAECYQAWRDTWDLDDMTPREIYEAGFRHGAEKAVPNASNEWPASAGPLD